MISRRRSEKRAADAQIPRHVSTNATIAVIAAIVLLLYLVRQILLPFVIAGAVAFVCTPFVDLVSRRARLPRGLAAFATGFVLSIGAVALAWLAKPLLLHAVAHAFRELSDMRSVIHQWIGGSQLTLFGKTLTDAEIAQMLGSAAQRFYLQAGGMGNLLLWCFAGVFGALLTVVLVFYFLISAPAIADGFVWLIPPLDRPLVSNIMCELGPLLRRYFTGLGLVVLYASAAAYFGLDVILHAPHALFLALLTGVLELVPIVGPAASAIVAGVFTIHGAKGPNIILLYVLYVSALRLSIDQLVGPVVLGRETRIQPSLVIFCFLAGAILFGVPGIILAVPAALAVRTTLSILYGEERTVERHPNRSG